MDSQIVLPCLSGTDEHLHQRDSHFHTRPFVRVIPSGIVVACCAEKVTPISRSTTVEKTAGHSVRAVRNNSRVAECRRRCAVDCSPSAPVPPGLTKAFRARSTRCSCR